MKAVESSNNNYYYTEDGKLKSNNQEKMIHSLDPPITLTKQNSNFYTPIHELSQSHHSRNQTRLCDLVSEEVTATYQTSRGQSKAQLNHASWKLTPNSNMILNQKSMTEEIFSKVSQSPEKYTPNYNSKPINVRKSKEGKYERLKEIVQNLKERRNQLIQESKKEKQIFEDQLYKLDIKLVQKIQGPNEESRYKKAWTQIDINFERENKIIIHQEFQEFLDQASQTLNSKHKFKHAYILPEKKAIYGLPDIIEFLNTRQVFIIQVSIQPLCQGRIQLDNSNFKKSVFLNRFKSTKETETYFNKSRQSQIKQRIQYRDIDVNESELYRNDQSRFSSNERSRLTVETRQPSTSFIRSITQQNTKHTTSQCYQDKMPKRTIQNQSLKRVQTNIVNLSTPPINSIRRHISHPSYYLQGDLGETYSLLKHFIEQFRKFDNLPQISARKTSIVDKEESYNIVKTSAFNSRQTSVSSLKSIPHTGEPLIKESRLLLLIGLFRYLIEDSRKKRNNQYDGIDVFTFEFGVKHLVMFKRALAEKVFHSVMGKQGIMKWHQFLKAVKILLQLNSNEKQDVFFETLKPSTQTEISQIELWELIKDILNSYSNSASSASQAAQVLSQEIFQKLTKDPLQNIDLQILKDYLSNRDTLISEKAYKYINNLRPHYF